MGAEQHRITSAIATKSKAHPTQEDKLFVRFLARQKWIAYARQHRKLSRRDLKPLRVKANQLKAALGYFSPIFDDATKTLGVVASELESAIEMESDFFNAFWPNNKRPISHPRSYFFFAALAPYVATTSSYLGWDWIRDVVDAETGHRVDRPAQFWLKLKKRFDGSRRGDIGLERIVTAGSLALSIHMRTMATSDCCKSARSKEDLKRLWRMPPSAEERRLFRFMKAELPQIQDYWSAPFGRLQQEVLEDNPWEF